MTYRLWWTVGYVCTTEKEFRAAKHRLLPAIIRGARRCLAAGQPGLPAGGVAWLIEGDDKTHLDRRAIEIDAVPSGRRAGDQPVGPANRRAAGG